MNNRKNDMNLKICKLHPNATVPQYQTEGAACFDLHAIETSGGGDYMQTICRTGLAFEIPEGWALMVYSRSGQGFNHAVRLSNCVGVIDSDYRGEVMVKLQRDKPWSYTDTQSLLARAGDRVAQAMLVQVPRVTFETVEQLSITERGDSGFGSTGGASA
jgi:dUTP pyrophosphatase